jgi:hypothetical protein
MSEVMPGKVRSLTDVMPLKSASNYGDKRPGALAAGLTYLEQVVRSLIFKKRDVKCLDNSSSARTNEF